MQQTKLLFGELPKSVQIDGSEYLINWGFRTFILIEALLFNPSISDEEKTIRCLTAFYGDRIPRNVEVALQKLLWFYSCGKQEDIRDAGEEEQEKANQKRCYDFTQDSDYIVSAFRTQYGIDLTDSSCKLHWWTFRTLMIGLNDDLQFTKIMYYRMASTKGMSKEQKKFIAKMRKKYALKDETTAKQKLSLAERDARWRAKVEQKMKKLEEKKNGS